MSEFKDLQVDICEIDEALAPKDDRPECPDIVIEIPRPEIDLPSFDPDIDFSDITRLDFSFGDLKKLRKLKLLFKKFAQLQVILKSSSGISFIQDVPDPGFETGRRKFYLKKFELLIDKFEILIEDFFDREGIDFDPDIIEKISFEFDKFDPLNPFKVERFTILDRAGKFFDVPKIDFDPVLQDPTLMKYFIDIDSIFDRLTVDTSWIDIMLEITYPRIQIDYGSFDDLDIDFGDLDFSLKFRDLALGSFKFPDIMMYSLEIPKIKSIDFNKTKYSLLRQGLSVLPPDLDFSQLPDINLKQIENIFDEFNIPKLDRGALMELYNRFGPIDKFKAPKVLKPFGDFDFERSQLLDFLTPCKWKEVLEETLKSKLSDKTLEQATRIIIRTALLSASPLVLRKIYGELAQDVTQEIEQEIRSELQIDSFAYPWDVIQEVELERSILDRQKILDQLEESLDEEIDAQVKRLMVEKIIEKSNIDKLSEFFDMIPGADIYKLAVLSDEVPFTPNINSGIEKIVGVGGVDLCDDGRFIKKGLPQLPKMKELSFKFLLDVLIKEFKKLLIKLLINVLLSIVIKFIDKAVSSFPPLPDLPQLPDVPDISDIPPISNFPDLPNLPPSGRLDPSNLMRDLNDVNFGTALSDVFFGPPELGDTAAGKFLEISGVPARSRDRLIKAISNTLTAKELKAAMAASPENQNGAAIAAVYTAIRGTGFEVPGVLSSPEDVQAMFANINSYLTPDQKARILNSITPEDDMPINKSICLTKEERCMWNDQRLDAFKDLGFNDDEANDFLDRLNDKSDQDLADVVDALFNAPDNILGDALDAALDNAVSGKNDIGEPQRLQKADDYDEDNLGDLDDKDICFDVFFELTGQTGNNSITIPTDMKNLFKNMNRDVFRMLNFAFSNDLIGRRNSFFENVLADRRGTKLTAGLFDHETRVRLRYPFPNAADTEEQHAEKFDGAGKILKRVMEKTRIMDKGEEDPAQGDPSNLFPLTVGIHMKNQLHATLSDLGQDNFELRTEMNPKGKAKKADFRLEFRDKVFDEDPPRDFEFGNDILYRDFTYPNQTFTKDGLYELAKIDKLPQGGNFKDVKVQASYGLEKFSDIIEEIDVEESELVQPYIVHLFKNFFAGNLDSLGVSNISIDQAAQQYESMSRNIFSDVINAIFPNDGTFPRKGFVFGYVDDRIKYENLLYVGPNATSNKNTWKYEEDEEDKILGKAAVAHDRVKFLDPAIHGGSYVRPKIYIEPTQHVGWMGFMQTLMPEPDGHEPKSEDFLFVSDISKRISDKQLSPNVDDRLRLDPEYRVEGAFNKVLTPSSSAYLEGIVRMTVRAYCMEFMLRCYPVIQNLKLDFDSNFDDGILSFIAAKMEQGMREQDGFGRIKEDKYWLLFCEQAVQQAYGLVEDEILEPDAELIELLQEGIDTTNGFMIPNDEDRKLLLLVESWDKSSFLNRVARAFFRDGLQVSDRQERRIVHILNALLYYSKGEYYEDYIGNKQDRTFSYRPMITKYMTVKFLRKAVREYDVRNRMALCRKVLKYYIKKELQFYADKFNENMPFPSRIDNLQEELLGDMFISKTPLDVIPREPLANPPLDGLNITEGQYSSLLANGSFYIEKYAILVTNNQTTPDYFKPFDGINRIDELQDVVNSYTGDKNVYVSDVFGTASVLGSGRRRNNNEEEETGKPTPKSQKEKRDERKQKRKERREERAEDRERRREEQANGYAGSIGIRMGLRVMYCPQPEVEPLLESINFDPETGESGGSGLPLFPSGGESGTFVMGNLSNIQNPSEMALSADGPIQQLWGGLSGGYFIVDGVEKYYNSMGDSFPIFSYERDIKDVKLKDLRLDLEDLDCYVDELIKSRKFNFFFGSVLPVRRAASMVAIYCYDGFVQSVGLGDDEREEGEEGSRGRWRQKLLKRTKRNLYHMFVSNLKSMSNRKDKFDDGNRSQKRFRRKRFPRQLQNIDKGVKWWQLRKKVGRPFDKNGNPKIDIVNMLFGD